MVKFIRFLVFFALVTSIFNLSVGVSHAVEQNWLNSTDIRFSQIKQLSSYTELPSTTHGLNTDCSYREITTRPERASSVSYLPEIKASDCMNDTSYGAVGGSWFLRNGTNVAGSLFLRSPKEFLLSGPNLQSGILGDATAPIGFYVSIIPNLESQIDTIVDSSGNIKHSLKSSATVQNIKNSKNERLSAMFETVAFSSNGQWMLLDSPFYGLVRVNTLTGDTLSFGTPTNYNSGFNSTYQTAISASGRYATVSTNGLFRVYDLDNCLAGTGSLSHLKDCSYKSLEELRQANANYGSRPAYIRFTSEKSLSYYVAQAVDGVTIHRQYQVSVGDVPQFGSQYLGLGDSYASGEGSYIYKPITETETNTCHTSLLSYPYLLGKYLNKEKYESIACSGARTEDVTSNLFRDYTGQIGDGIAEKDRNINSIVSQYLPGKITQFSFLDLVKPESVTISIGGNDLAFAKKLQHCIIGIVPDRTCFDTYEDRREIALEIYNLVPTLKTTYEKLRQNNRRVYVLGYPKIVKPGGDCAVNVSLNAVEVDFADKLTVLLNDAIELAAKQAGVVYVDVEDIFDGRRLCETDSSNTLIHGITQGDDIGLGKIKILASESFHPKAEAHQFYKNAVLAGTNNLTKPMEAPDTSATYRMLDSTDAFFINLQKTNRQVYQPIYQDLIKDRVNTNSQYALSIDRRTSGFDGLQLLNIELHSTPISFGSFSTDAQGNLNAVVTIPESIEPGYHSLHIYGTTLTGQQVDIYDYVLVGKSDSDFDGDGVLDANEGCVFTTPLGIDTDKDGLDNACDGFANPIPEPIPTPAPIPEPTPTPVPTPDPIPAPEPPTKPEEPQKNQLKRCLKSQGPLKELIKSENQKLKIQKLKLCLHPKNFDHSSKNLWLQILDLF